MRTCSRDCFEQVILINRHIEDPLEKLVLMGQNGMWGVFTKCNEQGGVISVTAWLTLREVSYFLDGVQWALEN